MNTSSTSVRSVADTARWVAYFRALENERPDALFRDPFAKSLAGHRGFQIANTLPDGNKHEWAWVARTYLFDQFVGKVVREGSDTVINLAAGLDARPYRMDLPSDLVWIEVDFPEIVSYKEDILSAYSPKCRLERISLDLADASARRQLFRRVNDDRSKVAVMAEGLLIYLTDREVASLAIDLAECSHFSRWIVDLTSPGQLKYMQRNTGKQLEEAGAALKFGPVEGEHYFAPYGWKPSVVESMLRTAVKFKRAPSELLGLLPEPKKPWINYPWTGVCLLEKD